VTAAAAPALPAFRGHSKTTTRRLFIFFGIGFAIFLGLALLGIFVSKPAGPKPPCAPGERCLPPSTAPALLTGRIWTSDLGLQMEYYPDIWGIQQQDTDGRNLHLVAGSSHKLEIRLKVAPADTQPADLVRQALDDLRQDVPTLAVDDRAEDQMLDPAIGSVDGIGSAYAGTVDETSPIEAFVLGATDSKVTAVVTVTTTFPRSTKRQYSPFPFLNYVDALLNTVRWPSQPRPGQAAS
jgi:hypothetical protein